LESRHVKEAKGGSDERHLLSDWVKGDVFAAVGDGKYNVFSNTGIFKETIDTGFSGFLTTGCAFNQDRSKLYTTVFDASKVVVFDTTHPHTILQTINTSPGSGTESVVFDTAGNFYVGHVYGDTLIRKYNASGTFLESYSAAIEDSGTDWIDLATDQCTLFYTSQGRLVKRFDVCANTQLTDFTTLPRTGYGLALRLLPPSDGTGGLLVSTTITSSDSMEQATLFRHMIVQVKTIGFRSIWIPMEPPSGPVMLQLVISTALKLLQVILWLVHYHLLEQFYLDYAFLAKLLWHPHAVTK
jgi:hypothetical protein